MESKLESKLNSRSFRLMFACPVGACSLPTSATERRRGESSGSCDAGRSAQMIDRSAGLATLWPPAAAGVGAIDQVPCDRWTRLDATRFHFNSAANWLANDLERTNARIEDTAKWRFQKSCWPCERRREKTAGCLRVSFAKQFAAAITSGQIHRETDSKWMQEDNERR